MTETGTKIRAAIFGASGYGGSELLRILLFHPNAEVVLATANEHAGKPVTEVHKNLRGLTNIQFEKAPDDLSTCRACHLPLTDKDYIFRYDEYFQKRTK